MLSTYLRSNAKKHSTTTSMPKMDQAYNSIMLLKAFLERSSENAEIVKKAKVHLENAEKAYDERNYTLALESAENGKKLLIKK